MKNPQLKYILILLISTILISAGMFFFVSKNDQLKIIPCTQFDVYDGSNHTKLAPIDINCSFKMLDLSAVSSPDQGFVEYDINIMGDLLILVVFVIIPLFISYLLMILAFKKGLIDVILRHGKKNNSKTNL